MKKGESGMTPSKVGSKKGAYQYSENRMGDAKTPNMQGWNSYTGKPTRKAGIKSGGMKKSSGSSDY